LDYDVYDAPLGRRSGGMPKTVDVHEARTHPSRLLDRVRTGLQISRYPLEVVW
jgi:hypothetical protein